MTIRGLAGVLALLGGAAWAAAAWLGETAAWWSELRWGGLGAVLLAFVCLGLNLLSGRARWLDLVVGVAFPLLAWTVYEVLGDVVGQARVLHGVLGAGFVVVGAMLLRRRRDPRQEPASRPTSHRA